MRCFVIQSESFVVRLKETYCAFSPPTPNCKRCGSSRLTLSNPEMGPTWMQLAKFSAIRQHTEDMSLFKPLFDVFCNLFYESILVQILCKYTSYTHEFFPCFAIGWYGGSLHHRWMCLSPASQHRILKAFFELQAKFKVVAAPLRQTDEVVIYLSFWPNFYCRCLIKSNRIFNACLFAA